MIQPLPRKCMKSNFLKLLSTLIIISCIYLSAQPKTYFFKYKESVPKSEVTERILSKELLSGNKNAFLNTENIFVDHFAKGMALDIEPLSRIIKIVFNSEHQSENFYTLALQDPLIEYVQHGLVYKIDYSPNDSLVPQQWALNKIDAFNAWDISLGSDTVLIGIIDTGIDYEHVDLINKIHLNTGEIGIDNFGRDKRSNGVDDDNNGFIDDYMGWDFTDRVGFPFDSTGGDYLTWDNDPKDEQGHGTYIAGIAGASVNNLYGVAGIAPNCKLLNLRAFDPIGFGEEDDVAAAILYAIKQGVKVINMSFGDNAFSYVLRDVIRYAYSRGIVLVASAGNSNSSNPHYPSGYSEVICVGNSTSDDLVASSSNFGSTIDLVAPGTMIMTTARGNNYALISGTSASAPFVSGAAALILSLENFSNEEVKQILKSTTDDIGPTGWDLRSGAGRINLYRALNVIAPSKIKFNHPTQDFATSGNSLEINATILSPYFLKYELYYGIGLNPNTWTALITNGFNQFNNQNIYNLNISSFVDTSYNLRLVVYLSNGRTLEERVNFYVDRTPPKGELISIVPAFYGNRTTILAAVESDEVSVARLYYRKFGETNFNFITLDGFASNNQFFKRLHYGFIPKHLVEQNSSYQVYITLENLVGLKSTVIYNNDSIFNVTTEYNAVLSSEVELPYSLRRGTIFKNPTNFISQNFNEVLFSEFYPTQDLYYGLYRLEGDSFIKVDSIKNKLPRDVGDFNNNGKIDLLSSIQRFGFIDEQLSFGEFKFTNKFFDSTGAFWPVLARDIDFDGITEILYVDSDTSITVRKVNQNLSLGTTFNLPNFTSKGLNKNLINSPHAVVTDTDNDGRNEIWMVDGDGDIFSYKILNPVTYVPDKVISTEFLGSSSLLDAGDYNGDGYQDIAVLIHSIENIDIAPFYRLLVFTFAGDSLNSIYDQAFIDASVEFNSSFRSAESSIRFADLDLDGRQELVVFVFPYAYIFSYFASQNRIVSFKENINSSSIFIGDLNRNGVKEIAFPSNEGIKFFEFTLSSQASVPYDFVGYSLDSSSIYLKWAGIGSKFYIYRGTNSLELLLIDSTSVREYVDTTVLPYKDYFYAIKAYDEFKPVQLSNFSQIITVYSHNPARVEKVVSFTSKSLTVKFTERVSNSIDNLQSFRVLSVGSPSSISPQDQKSLLLTFSQNLPIGNNRLIVTNMTDYFGSPIKTDTIDFIVDSIAVKQEQFFIVSYQLINPYKLRLTFSIDVDEASASNPANYIFRPEIAITTVSIDQNDKRNVILNWENQKPVSSVGREYVLKINNLKSSTQTGYLPIATGAGSYVVLTSFAKDLSDVFVYPQPARLGNGNNKITFANLPSKAKIIIFNLDGKQIADLEENNGDGGVDFNLTDINGKPLSSGIYIYRIVQFDSSGNEVEERIGKFAVVR